MRSVLAVGSGLLAAGLSGCVARRSLGGPLPVRNQHPAQLTVMHMAPASADVLPAGEIALRSNLAYTSLFLLGSGQGSSWLMDGEYLRSAATLRLGLGAGLELTTQLAAAHTGGGFLDSFIIDYHDLFGFPDQGREASPRNDFVVEARRGSQQLWSVEERGFEWLDAPLYLTWQLREPGPDRLGVAVRGGIELPLGNEDRGYGSGGVDASIGGLVDYRHAGVGWFGHLQHTFASTPSGAAQSGLTFADVTAAGVGSELPLSESVAALVQVEWESSTLRRLGPRATSRAQLLLWAGLRWQPAPAWGVEVGFGEDLIGLVSPDFSAWLAVTWRP